MLDIENIDWSKFQLAKSGRAVKLVYDKGPVQVCTSSLYSPFGVKCVSKDWSNFTEFFIDCSLNNANKEVTFRKFVESLDECICKLVKENGNIFNTRKVQSFTGDFNYAPMLRENGDYPKLMKLQFSRDKNGNFESFFFDEKREKLLVDEQTITELLQKGRIFKCIIECSKVWSYNGRVGSTWNVVQLRLAEKRATDATASNQNNVYNTLMIED